MKVGYLGPGKGTFGFMAAEKFFAGRDDIEFIPHANHAEICRAVADDEIDFGVVAAENVIDGVVKETIDTLDKLRRSSSILIVGEVEIPIKLFLLRMPGDDNEPAKIIGHLVALGQCSKKVASFKKSHNDIPTETVDSNGKAAEIAAKDSSCIAISTEKAEKEYGLIRVEPDSMTNNPNNFTRFWILGTKKAKPSDRDKTCLLVNLNQDVPGGISRVLTPFASRGINLLVIAPLPIPGRKWEYSFMVEFSGSLSGDQNVKDAYEELCASGASMDAPLVLGSYPAGTI